MSESAFPYRDRPWYQSHDVWACSALVLLGVLFFVDPLFSSKNFYFRDILNFHYPLRRVLIDAYGRGEFPLWNPFIYLGQPMLANPNYMAFYPTNLFHLLFSFNYAFKLHFIVHPLLAGLGAFALQRRLGISALPAFGGAIAYQFSGTVLSFLNLYNIVPAVALLPWIGWALVGAFEGPWFRRCLWFGMLLALQVIAFEPLMFQNVLWLAGGLSLHHILESHDRLRATGAVARTALVGGAFGAALSAAQVLPTLELLPISGRSSALIFQEVSRWSMHPLDFLSTIVPNLFGNYYRVALATSWGGSIHEGREGYLVSFFFGGCVLILALASAASSRKRLRVVLLGLVLLSAGLALGKYSPAYRWMLDYIPLLRLGRYPCKYFLLGMLSVALLAALGLEALVKREPMEARRKRLIVMIAAGGLALAAVVMGCWLFWLLHPAALENMVRAEAGDAELRFKNFPVIASDLRRSILSTGIFLLLGSSLALMAAQRRRPALVGGLFLVLVGAELFPANLRLSPLMAAADVDFIPEVNTFIKGSGPREPFRVVTPTLLRPMPDLHLRTPNRSAAWLILFYKMSGQPFFGIMNGIEYSLDRSVDHLNTLESEELWSIATHLREADGLALLQKLNSPLLLSLGETRDPRARHLATFDTRSELPVQAYWLEDTVGRAYFVPGVQYAASHREALLKFLSPGFPFGSTVVLEGVPVREAAGQAGAGVASVLDYGSQRVLCQVEAKSAGYLVLLDSYYPGWSAYLDGQRVEIRRANYAFRAVPVPAGIHEVEFRYRPSPFYAGLAISCSALLVGAGVVALGWRPARSGRGAESDR